MRWQPAEELRFGLAQRRGPQRAWFWPDWVRSS